MQHDQRQMSAFDGAVSGGREAGRSHPVPAIDSGQVPIEGEATGSGREEFSVAREVDRRTGVAAVLAGLFFFAGQAGELVFGSPSRVVDVLFIVLGGIGIIALGVAVWGLRSLVSSTRHGRVGWWLAIAGAGLLNVFAVQAAVSTVRTGQVPENFILFLLGFLLLVVGQVLFARDLRQHVDWGWLMPLVAAAGLVVALTATDALGPTHDIGLFIFEAAWVALGVALTRSVNLRRAHRRHSAPSL